VHKHQRDVLVKNFFLPYKCQTWRPEKGKPQRRENPKWPKRAIGGSRVDFEHCTVRPLSKKIFKVLCTLDQLARLCRFCVAMVQYLSIRRVLRPPSLVIDAHNLHDDQGCQQPIMYSRAYGHHSISTVVASVVIDSSVGSR